MSTKAPGDEAGGCHSRPWFLVSQQMWRPGLECPKSMQWLGLLFSVGKQIHSVSFAFWSSCIQRAAVISEPGLGEKCPGGETKGHSLPVAFQGHFLCVSDEKLKNKNNWELCASQFGFKSQAYPQVKAIGENS